MTEDEIDSITESVDLNLSNCGRWWEDRGDWHAAVHEVTESRT